jgi:hypothetical protein
MVVVEYTSMCPLRTGEKQCYCCFAAVGPQAKNSWQ